MATLRAQIPKKQGPQRSRPRLSAFDFSSAVGLEQLAREQGVAPIRRRGQIRGFSNADPKEAEWFARELRRWRSNGTARTRP